jgi:hypothetical protein
LSTTVVRSGAASAYTLATTAALRKSSCSAGSFGFAWRVSVFKPDRMPPRSSPWPRRPSANALKVPLSSTGSTLCSRSINDWNKVLTSSCTEEAATCASGRRDVGEGACGGMNSTDLAPKMVLPARRTVALDGMKCMSSLLIPSVSRAWSPE